MDSSAPLLLVYLSSYHLGDPLFLRGFVRDVQAHVGPLILMHGSGEEGERALEARGLLTSQQRGSVVAKQLVERAMRDLNRRIVHELNEGGVPAVGLFGVDRGLLRQGEGGLVEAGKAAWLAELAMQRAIPVVGGLIAGSGDDLTEADVGQILAVLSVALSNSAHVEVHIVAFTSNRKSGLFDGEERIATVRVGDTGLRSVVADLDVLSRTASTVRIRLTTPQALRGEGLPNGTDLVS